MTHLDEKLGQLKHAVIEMMDSVQLQLEKSKEAFLNSDSDLAEEIISTEKRVNAMEISIDRDCERIFALINPLASDLRYVISVLKINSDLERIGDYAEAIAHYIIEMNQVVDSKLVEKLNINKMFDIAISMIQDIKLAFEQEDTVKARKIFKKDITLNKIDNKASIIISNYIKENPDTINESLLMFSTVRKLERVGDHIKNIAEDIIFYMEAKVLKHKDKNKDV